MKMQYIISVLEEHLEEASFLYEHSVRLREDPRAGWAMAGGFEDRLEAHIDGLVLAGEVGRAVCEQALSDAGPGELHTALRVFCRNAARDQVLGVLQALDLEDASLLTAACDALNQDFPEAWEREFLDLAVQGDPVLIRVMTRLAGHRRLGVDAELLQSLPRIGQAALPEVIHALGRLRSRAACPVLAQQYLAHGDPMVCAASALALLLAGDPAGLSECMARARTHTWPLLPLALGGGPDAVALITDLLDSGGPRAHCLLALGLLGDPGPVSRIMGHLDDPETAESAAVALDLITGAGLTEEVNLTGEEGEGEEAGGTGPEVRLSRDRGTWRQWWEGAGGRFSPGRRFLFGLPCTPERLVEALAGSGTPARLRELLADELVIRYGMDIPFGVDMQAAAQRSALGRMQAWARDAASRFGPGGWYCGGAPQG